MKKPTSMMVLGILNVSFAGLGLMGALFGLVTPFLPLPGTEIYDGAYEDGTFLAVFVGVIVVGMLSKLVMGVSGVGLLQGKPWGRSLGNLWAVFSMLYGLTAVVLAITYTFPAMDAAVADYLAQNPNPQDPMVQQALQQHQLTHDITMIVTVVMGIAQALIYQVVFLFLNNRKAVRDYLASRAGGGDGYEAQPYGGHPSQEPAPPSDSPW